MRTNRKLDPIFRWLVHHDLMTHVELIPVRTPDGTIVLRGVAVGPVERLRRLVRRLLDRA
jgi:hypothetical protein